MESNLLSLYDPVDRDCEYYPFTDKYDPRLLIAGDYQKNLRLPTQSEMTTNGEEQKSEKSEIETETANESWLSGLFDRDSFTEYLSQWATSVCIGRARLGGIPVCVIAAETRTTQCCIPPDPALESDSSEIMWSKPGKVWYPDSSFKTAQAIRDFKCENLPLFILANWRGFSGGQRDMFHQILKYGSYIVDELQSYAAHCRPERGCVGRFGLFDQPTLH
ncbi:MAG: hypothetical protein GY938_15110 [Ketobacter sp.]|nr:hypothetical protein [Ketobacter sp.]